MRGSFLQAMAGLVFLLFLFTIWPPLMLLGFSVFLFVMGVAYEQADNAAKAPIPNPRGID